ncbi:MAG: sigma-54 dependent transcriptional regulator [Ktedonobacterales bacterium]
MATTGKRVGAAKVSISTTKGSILICDDDQNLRGMLSALLSEEGYTTQEAATGADALEKAAQRDTRPDLILLDIRMPDQNGIEIMQRLLEQGVDAPVILMTGFTTASLAIKAMQMGAADYLSKPFSDLDEVLISIDRVLSYERLKREVEGRSTPSVKVDASERIVGSSQEMVDIFKLIGRVARTPATVLITGETGTGKELMAEAIHNASDRRNGPLIKVNCAALPETLLESELFGHEKGSFTGALTQHKGRFEAAHKGTIFLDEVGEMTFGTQKKLLRVLQEREFERVGGTAPVKVDVRVLAATNRNLRDEVMAGRFREDLFFRLNVISVHMPPLRNRREDIPALVSHFLDKHRYSPASQPARISQEAMDKLMAYDWPGNVRELENIMQRAVVLGRGDVITPDQIVFHNEMNRYVLDVEQKVRASTPLEVMLHDVLRQAIRAALRLNDQDHAKAAEQLGVSLDVFEAHLKQLGE